MSEKIVQLNEEVIKDQIKEGLGSIETQQRAQTAKYNVNYQQFRACSVEKTVYQRISPYTFLDFLKTEKSMDVNTENFYRIAQELQTAESLPGRKLQDVTSVLVQRVKQNVQTVKAMF